MCGGYLMKLLHQGDHQLKLTYRTTLDFPIHIQNAVEILFLTSGETTVIYGAQRLPMETGDLLVVFPNQLHGFENSRNVTGYMLIVPMHPYLAAYHRTLEDNVPLNPIVRPDQWQGTLIDQLMELSCKEWSSVDPGIRQGYVLLIVGKLLSLLPLTATQKVSGTALQEVLDFLNNHYTEALSRESVAQAVGYHESYLSHLFSESLHITMKDYITALRVRQAAHLLKNSEIAISDIATSVGFGSIRSFNRAFIQIMECTPTQYRKQ